MGLEETVKQWQAFYATLGGATATLLGLLFVAISIHSNRIHDEDNAHFLKLARLTFSNYLMLMVLAVQMLVPMRAEVQLSVPLAGVGMIGLFWTVYLRQRKEELNNKHARFLRRSYYMALFSYIAILVILGLFYKSPSMILYLMLSPVVMLVVSSIRNSWGLMMMLRSV